VIDSHCHLADPAFALDLDAVVDRARAAGLASALCVLAAEEASEAAQARRLAALWPEARFSVGVHPHQAHEFAGRVEGLGDLVRGWLGEVPNAAAIGEIGLDYHYHRSPRDVQRAVFAAQIGLARDTGLPLVVHSREADSDTIDILGAEGRGGVDGVFHCFSGGRTLADAALDLGFYVSFSGILTFPRAEGLRQVAAAIPDDRLLVETDCPYLAPVPYRGRRNEPAWVVQMAAALAEIRRVPVAAIDATVTANFARLFAAEGPWNRTAGPSAR